MSCKILDTGATRNIGSGLDLVLHNTGVDVLAFVRD